MEYARRYPVPDDQLLDEDPPATPLGIRPPARCPPYLSSVDASSTGSLLQVEWGVSREG